MVKIQLKYLEGVHSKWCFLVASGRERYGKTRNIGTPQKTYLRTEVRGDPQGLGLDIYVRDYINVIHQLVTHDPIRGNEAKYAYK